MRINIKNVQRVKHSHTFTFDAKRRRDVCTSCPKVAKRIPAVRITSVARGGLLDASASLSIDPFGQPVTTTKQCENTLTETYLNSITIPALRQIAHQRGMTLPSKTRKAEYVSALAGLDA
jgi:hypothetical protein